MINKCGFCPYWKFNLLHKTFECTYYSDKHILFTDKRHACKKAEKRMRKMGYGTYR